MSKMLKPLLYFFVVFSGSSSSIVKKITFSTLSIGKRFCHPLFHNLIMFLAESTGIITFLLLFKDEEKKILSLSENKNKTSLEFYKLCIPAIFDLISSIFNTLCIDFLPGSLSRMFEGFSILITFGLSITFMKNKHSKNNYIGILIIIIGLFLLGLSEYIYQNNSNSTIKYLFFGIICSILSNFLGALHEISQEYFIRKQVCHPIRCIGFEGFFGFILTFILTLFAINIKCSNKKIRDNSNTNSILDILSSNVCIVDEEGNSYIENMSFIWRQIKNNTNLFLYYIAIFFICILLNYSYVSFIKIAGASARIVLANITSLCVWIFFLLPIHKNKKYQEKFKIIQLIGFFVLVFGVLFYNELILKNTKKDINYNKIEVNFINNEKQNSIIEK